MTDIHLFYPFCIPSNKKHTNASFFTLFRLFFTLTAMCREYVVTDRRM